MYLFDLVYLPLDFRKGVNLGCAFVDLITNEVALTFVLDFRGFSKCFVDNLLCSCVSGRRIVESVRP